MAASKKINDEMSECGNEKDKNDIKPEDPRSIPTRINLTKNKLRSMGLKMSYDMGNNIE